MIKRPDITVWNEWNSLLELPQVNAWFDDLYARAEATAASLGPVCKMSGRCCKFSETHANPKVTGLEIARMLRNGATLHPVPGGDCPMQNGVICTARQHRFLVCRMWACNVPYIEFMKLYIKFSEELVTFHAERNVVFYKYRIADGLQEGSKML